MLKLGLQECTGFGQAKKGCSRQGKCHAISRREICAHFIDIDSRCYFIETHGRAG